MSKYKARTTETDGRVIKINCMKCKHREHSSNCIDLGRQPGLGKFRQG